VTTETNDSICLSLSIARLHTEMSRPNQNPLELPLFEAAISDLRTA
jgi:hypothetical protein